MTPPTDSLVAALRAVPLERLCLTRGVVGSYDGAYDWVRKDSVDPDEAPGEHPGSDLCDAYVIVQVADLDALAAAAREWVREHLPENVWHIAGEPRDPRQQWEETGYNTALTDVLRRLGL